MLGLVGLAAGMAAGKQKNERLAREDERQAKQDAWQEEQRNALRQERQQQLGLQTGLRDAAAPATMEPVAGSQLEPDQVGPSLALFRVKGNGIDQTTADKPEAEKSLAGYNSPDAVVQRQAGVLRSAGAPDKAISLESGALSLAQARAKAEDEKRNRTKELESEGILDAVRALNMGDAQGVFDKFNASGKFKLAEVPVITQEIREIPGMGKVPTFTARAKLVQPDGTVKEGTYNSFDMSMQLMEPLKAIEQRRKMMDTEADVISARSRATSSANGSRAGGKDSPTAADKLDIQRARERRLDIKDRIATVIKKLDSRLISREDAQTQLRDLQEQQARYDKVIQDAEDGAPAPAPGLAPGKAPAAGKAPSYSNLWK